MEETSELVSAGEIPALFSQYHAALLAFAVRRIGYDLAEDAVQETWFRLLRALHAGTPLQRVAILGWLYRVLAHLIIDRLRKQQRLLMLPLLDIEEEPHVAEFEEQVASREALERVLARMSPLLLETLTRSQQGYRQLELGPQLGVTESAAKMRLGRARAQFIALWKQEEAS